MNGLTSILKIIERLAIKKSKQDDDLIKELIKQDYQQQYLNECKYIWKNYVPKRNQAKNLQGELLREMEKIRCEAQDNGNINWDDDYSYFCDFITKSLLEQKVFSNEEKKEICSIMRYIKECGLYAQRYNNKEIEESKIDPNKIAYTEDNLYDIICDKIGKLQKEHPEPIPYKENKNIRR